MKDVDAITTIVCMPVSQQPRTQCYQGNCDECDCAIWIAYSSSEMLSLAERKICIDCMLKLTPDTFEVISPEGESLRDIMEKTGQTKEQIQSITGQIVQWIKDKRNSIG